MRSFRFPVHPFHLFACNNVILHFATKLATGPTDYFHTTLEFKSQCGVHLTLELNWPLSRLKAGNTKYLFKSVDGEN